VPLTLVTPDSGPIPPVSLAWPNPRTQRQGIRVFSAAVAGPALLYAGYKFPGTWPAKGVLMASGALVIYTHWVLFRRDLSGEEGG